MDSIIIFIVALLAVFVLILGIAGCTMAIISAGMYDVEKDKKSKDNESGFHR